MKTEHEALMQAQQYADTKVPLLHDYHEWKKHKESFLAGWKAYEAVILNTSKELCDAMDKPKI